MITKIEISGFKTFRNFELILSPFSVIAGLNAVGKSNLFDALQLLSHLASFDLRTAFKDQRGDAYELFSMNADGTYGDEMKFAVELLVDKEVKDAWGGIEQLKYTRLRYELEIKMKAERGINKLYVQHEKLIPIPKGTDKWLHTFIPSASKQENWIPKVRGGRVPFISTENKSNPDISKDSIVTINLHQDKGSHGRPRPAFALESTMLSSVTNTEFPHVLAVKEEMMHWQFLQLSPEALRQPSQKISSKDTLGSNGAHLAATLFRIKSESPETLKHISREMSNLVNDITAIDVFEDKVGERYVVKATTKNNNTFSSQVLSEGTLRLIALCTLKYDARHKGIICFEEPENGIHPGRMKQVLKLLWSMSTELTGPVFPLRQILVNTHSPRFITSLKSMLTPHGLPGNNVHLYFARLDKIVSKEQDVKITKIIPAVIVGQAVLDFHEVSEVDRKINALELVDYLEKED